MARFHTLSLVGSLLLGGCASGTYTLPAKDILQQAEVTLGVSASVGAGRTVQSVVSPWTSSDVDHLKMDLYKQVDGVFTKISTQETAVGSGVTKTVNFTHLKMNTAYKIAVTCQDASGASLNKADGSGEATITTSNDNYVPVTVNVNLADKTFDGTMHPVVSVTNGAVNDTSTAEAGSVVDNN